MIKFRLLPRLVQLRERLRFLDEKERRLFRYYPYEDAREAWKPYEEEVERITLEIESISRTLGAEVAAELED